MAALSNLIIESIELANAMANAPTAATSATGAATPTELSKNGPQALILLDVRSAEEYASAHIHGAHRLEPSLLNRSAPPINGLLPNASEVADWSARLGLQIDSTLVVYDGGKSTAAARALWVLNVYGFTNVHWLNGGLPAWVSSGQPVTADATPAPTAVSAQSLTANPALVITNEELKAKFSNAATSNDSPESRQSPKHQLIDARTKGEYEGSDVRSARGGRMPGAVHYEWLDMFQSDGTLQPDSELKAALAKRQLADDVPAIVYCQSHQRSAVTYVVLKHLGYKDVSALDGAWSNWGNDPTTPIEI